MKHSIGRRNVNILHVSPLYFPADGGAERHVKEVSERLASRGHRVTVITAKVRSEQDLSGGVDGALADAEMINGVQVMRLHATRTLPALMMDAYLNLRGGYRSLACLMTASGLEMLSKGPRNLRFLRSTVRSDADIVASWNWLWPTSYHVYLARKLKGFRLVGIPLFHTAQRWAQRPVYDRMVAACSAILVNTIHEKEFIRSRVPKAEQIVVAGVGVDPQIFSRRDGSSFRMRYGIGPGPLIGFVGRMIANKGADKVVEAMPIVWKWNKDVHLMLAGLRSNDFPQLDAVLHNLAPTERERVLIFPNFPEDEKASLYDALDVFALPSTGESFGIAYLEAWMCRKPVVGARIGSTSCVIEEGTDGLLVDPSDPRDIARAVIELLADPDKRMRMGERGYVKTMQHFTWDKVTDRIEQVYLGVMAETSSPRSRSHSPISPSLASSLADPHKLHDHKAAPKTPDAG